MAQHRTNIIAARNAMNLNGCNNKRMSLSELAADYRLLESARCRCSSAKGLGEALCNGCWNKLSDSRQRALRSARPAHTFGTAYRAATEFLEQMGKRRASKSR